MIISRKEAVMRIAVIVVLLIATSSVAAKLPSKSGILIVQKIVTEAGVSKSQILMEFRLLDTKARRDTYLGGVKGNPALHKIRMMLPERQIHVLIDPMKGDCTIQGEAYFEKQKRRLRDILEGKMPGERPKLRPTEETKVIDGRKAVKYIAKSDKVQFTYWFVKDDQLIAAGKLLRRLTSTPAGALGSLQYPDPASFPGYPVKTTIVRHRNGMELTSHITSSVHFDVGFDPSLFELPAGCSFDG